jgi:hypothetical protein
MSQKNANRWKAEEESRPGSVGDVHSEWSLNCELVNPSAAAGI